MSDERSLLGWRIQHRVAAAYRAHLAGIHPPSNYCESLTWMARSTGNWTEGQLRAFALLMRGGARWDPDSRDSLNWLYLITSGRVKACWESFTTEELERILADLEAYE